MDVDSVDFTATAAADVADSVQPIQVQRARRTYASKPKVAAAAISTDERPSDLYSSSASGSLRTSAAVRPQTESSTTTTTATSTYQPGQWRNLLADIDKDSEMGSDDDKERPAAPRTALLLKTGKDVHTPTSSPPSPGASRSTSRQASRPREQTHQQYSANTSFASGTSGAISSPSSRTVPLTSPLDLFASDPLDALPSDDDASPVSEVPSSKQGTLPLRDKTPDSPARSRALEPTVFESPHRSFARATAQLKERKQPKFLGDDDDSDEEMAVTSTRSDAKDAKMDDIEAELGWVTDGSDKSRSKRRKSDKDEATTKIKKPTKKEVIEAEKETARMRAERGLDVQGKATFNQLSFTSHFQKKVELKSLGNVRLLNAVPPAPKPFGKPTRDDPAATDPISNFSSSPGTGPSEPSFDLEKAREDLRRRKLQAAQAPVITIDLDDSSDIEIIPETPGHAISPLDPVKKLEQVISKKKQRPGPMDVKKKALKPKGSAHEMTKEEHNRAIREKATAQSMALMEHKKTDFLERGGLLTKQAKAAASKGRNVMDLLDKAKVVADAAEQARQDDDDDDNDPSYEPEEDQSTLHGSSPTKSKPKVLVPDSSMVEGAMADVSLEEEDDTSHPIEISEHSETEGENEAAPVQQGNQKRRNVVLSDDEDENSHQASDGENIPPHQRSFSTSSENARFNLFTSLTRSVNATASRTPLGEIKTEKGKELFSDLPLSPISPSSPLQTLSPTQHKMKIDIPTSAQGSPLKRSGSSLLPAFEQSPTTSKRSAGASSPFGFSAIFGAEDDDKPGPGSRSGNSSVGVKPVNFGEISTQLFFSQPSPSQRASPIKKSRSSYGEKDPLAELRAKKDSDDFLLTQDGPLGRIELSTQQARDLQVVDQVDADAAFREGEEERRKKLEEAQEDNEPKWINDAGLFTQTKPAEVPWSLTQNLLSQPPLFFPQFTDLNAETMLSQRSPGKTPSRRLKRKGELADHTTTTSSSPPQSEEASSPERINALEYLMKPKKHKELDENNEFVYGEAEESDDDLALGFTNHRGADDEEAHIDPEEEAKYLDDKKMSLKDIREEAIIEKHREHLEQDDAELQKIHQAAVDGRLRKGKRNHGLLDDDSSEDEEKARGKKFKKRKVIGTDHLDDIARNPETAAFFKTYMKDLPGADEADPEDNEFAHLNVEADDVEADADYESDNGDEEMESGSETGEGPRKTITTNEILRIVQEKEERGEDLLEGEELMDADEYVRHHMPSSDAPMPGEYDNIQIISPRKRPGTKIVRKDVDVLFYSRFKGAPVDEAHAVRLAGWAKQNEKTREGTARGMASAAVTGHAKTVPSRTKSDKASLSKTSSMQARAPVRSETISSLSSKLSKKDSAWE